MEDPLPSTGSFHQIGNLEKLTSYSKPESPEELLERLEREQKSADTIPKE